MQIAVTCLSIVRPASICTPSERRDSIVPAHSATYSASLQLPPYGTITHDKLTVSVYSVSLQPILPTFQAILQPIVIAYIVGRHCQSTTPLTVLAYSQPTLPAYSVSLHPTVPITVPANNARLHFQPTTASLECLPTVPLTVLAYSCQPTMAAYSCQPTMAAYRASLQCQSTVPAYRANLQC